TADDPARDEPRPFGQADEVAPDLHVPLPGEVGGLLLDADLAPGRVGGERDADRDREPVGAEPAEHAGLVLTEEGHSVVPGRLARRRLAVVLTRLLAVAGADLLEVGVVHGRGLCEVAIRPDEYPLRAALDVVG